MHTTLFSCEKCLPRAVSSVPDRRALKHVQIRTLLLTVTLIYTVVFGKSVNFRSLTTNIGSKNVETVVHMLFSLTALPFVHQMPNGGQRR